MLNMLLKSCAAFVKYNSIFINGFSFLFPTFNHHFQTQLPHHFLSAAAACLWVIAQVYRQKWHESRSVGTRDLDPLLRVLVPVTPAQLQLHTPVMISHTISLNEFSFLSSPCQGHIHLDYWFATDSHKRVSQNLERSKFNLKTIHGLTFFDVPCPLIFQTSLLSSIIELSGNRNSFCTLTFKYLT